jgi:hypothetical protein
MFIFKEQSPASRVTLLISFHISKHKTMNRHVFLAVAIVLLAAIACKPAAKEETVVVPSSLFKAMVVRFPVSDYAKWKMRFLAGDSMRTANNIHNIGYGRGIEDTNTVVVIHDIKDLAQAKAFITSDEVKTAMDSAGVTGPPIIEFVDVVRNDSSVTDIKDRLMVKHAVKDFGMWLQVFDKEGMDVRKSHGLIDRAISRGLEDSNMVFVVFAVTDMEKAMARGKSDELKQIMTDAGVTGEPQFFAYRFDFLKE